MPGLQLVAKVAARFGQNFDAGLDKPPLLPIGLEFLKGNACCYRPDMLDGFDNVSKPRNR